MKKLTFRPFILPLLLVVCTVFYYFGELVDWAAWNSLRVNFFYGVHDVHRLLFLAPIVYAAYTARVRGAIVITLVSFVIFLPRAFFISPYPDPLLRMCLFTLFAGVVGVLVGVVRNQAVRAGKFEAAMAAQRDSVKKVMDSLPEGVMVTGPDYRIRYVNQVLKNSFGEAAGATCHTYLRGAAGPCEGCGLAAVASEGKAQRWLCAARDGRSYEAVGVPYLDNEGTKGQLTTLREVPVRQ